MAQALSPPIKGTPLPWFHAPSTSTLFCNPDCPVQTPNRASGPKWGKKGRKWILAPPEEKGEKWPKNGKVAIVDQGNSQEEKDQGNKNTKEKKDRVWANLGKFLGNFRKIPGKSVGFCMALSMNSVGIPGGFRGNSGFSGKFGVWGGFGQFGGSNPVLLFLGVFVSLLFFSLWNSLVFWGIFCFFSRVFKDSQSEKNPWSFWGPS